jgi:two-component system sensor histidine kinase PilS (NtrC family)
MKLGDSNRLLRGFGLARLAVAVLLLALGPMLPEELMPSGNGNILALALLTVVVTSGALAAFTPVTRPLRVAWLICLLDSALVTAVVAATGGARSIFAFLYVLSVTAACVLLSRTGGLTIAAAGIVLYSALVFARTVFPLTFLEAPKESTALEIITIFLNAGTFLIVAIVAGGLAERFRSTRQELETKQADLKDLEAFTDLVFHSVGTGLIAVDGDHRVTALNRAAERITGVAARAAVGRPWEVFGAGLALAAVEPEIDAPDPRPAWREVMLHRPGGDDVPVRMTFSALRAGDGRRIGLIAACEDLSAIRAMEARMRAADRLASLGRMAANIAHEIRNPLASLSGAVEVLAAGPPDDTRERLGQIVLKEAERLNTIIREFLEYARPAPLSRSTVNVGEVLDEVLVLLAHRAAPGTLKVAREFPPVLAWSVDRQQFRQVVWNLCLNALQAMPDGGELRVSAVAAGGRLVMRVADTGEGIAADDLGHIFEPFFSTKADGTGLGLALVHRIVQDHGGEIDVQSRPGVGSAFTLTLPAAHA